MISFLKIIRVPNLFIVCFIQCVIYYGVLIPNFSLANIDSIFVNELFPLFVFVTMIIAASGNVINDILDVKIDKINKPQKWIVGNVISIKNAWYYYYSIILLGFFLSFYIAIKINKIHFIFLYVFAVLFLFIYSRYLKKSFLSGNIFVSLFSSGVMGILLVFESEALSSLQNINYTSYLFVIQLISGFMVFSFFISMYRELVKDIEDMNGDKMFKAKTLPIVFGEKSAKFVAGIFAVVLLIFLIYWFNSDINYNKIYLKFYILCCLILSMSYSIYLLILAKNKSDYNKISKVIKLVMIAGISMLFFYI